MHKKYNHKNIEKKWQNKWSEAGIYKSKENDAPKYYILDMFPYPSGDGLHVGHPKGYIATDIFSRFKRMNGFNVLHPMGWDAFGLPAEQYAIKNKVHPRDAVEKNTTRFKEQLEIIGFDYDWDREINTTDPEFYKWTQWIFLKLLEKGLAYESYEPINWCPSCQTGLANEDLEDGKCERCGSEIEKKPMRQWVLKITDYADRMLEDLELLPKWPKPVKELQKNWIGKSEGSEIGFEINSNSKPKVLIIHGFEGDPSGGWKPWLKTSLEERGYEVRSPKMPNFDHPDYKESLNYLEQQTEDFSENDILVGHSLGGHFALKLAEKRKFGKVILVAPTIGGLDMPYDDWKKNDPESDFDTCEKILEDEPVQLNEILVGQKIAIFGETDRGIPIEHAKSLDSSWNVIKKPNTGHMSSEKEIPEILDSVLEKVTVFTTRPDTLFGATYMVLAPEHELVSQNKDKIENWEEVMRYIAVSGKKTEIERTSEGKEKTGVKLEGITATNPANNEEIPVYIADYVLAHYGTGAIMAVPAHDERDFEFATKYEIPIIEVIAGGDALPYEGDGELKNSDSFNETNSEDAKKAITEKVGGKMTHTYRLQDWVFSRQRYWGEPIPVVHCDRCGVVPVPEEELPVTLPDVENYAPTGTGESPLAEIDEWVNIKCPKCDGEAKRETNTMPQWAGSSWYYLRYMDPKNSEALVGKDAEKYWNQIDTYVGGMEHATRHLIYARFWHKFLYDIGVISTKEPFEQLYTVGLIQAEDGRKMSKRWGNVVNPDDVVNQLGADTLRVYEMFMGPFENAIAWSTDNVVGSRRFIEKVWRLQEKLDEGAITDGTYHKTIQKVGDDIESFNFNTAISQMMICVNEAEEKGITTDQYKTLLKILAPFAPHVSEELWHLLGEKSLIHLEEWPKADQSKLIDETVTLSVQINGKMRGTIEIPNDAKEEEVVGLLKEDQKISSKIPVNTERVVYVPGRIINLIGKDS